MCDMRLAQPCIGQPSLDCDIFLPAGTRHASTSRSSLSPEGTLQFVMVQVQRSTSLAIESF